MRLWSLHPKYLDAAGLVAVWREALLAQAVLRGRTHGYRRHPQLARFRACSCPVAAIATYLAAVHREARRRGYRFDATRIARARTTKKLAVTDGQVRHEWTHLKRKLSRRDRAAYRRLATGSEPEAHPLFHIVFGPVSDWERT
jgi:hypothetical protein